MIWEYQIMNDMRMKNYEWYENVKLWKIWECRNYERYENVKLWTIWEYKIIKIWEYIIMKDMRI